MIRCRAKAVAATLTLFLGFAGYTLVSSSADAQTQTSSTTICDILTAHPDDAQRVADPVPSAERDGARAVPACEEAVRRDPNNMRLRYQLGLAHDSAGNHAESIRHYAAAAERGYVAAGMALGWALANGEGVPRDDANAVRWYRWAADRGHSGAANTLGFMYENGRGVPRDYTQAANWYRRAYEGGRRPIAGFNLARLMSAGRGTPRDPQRAAMILRALAQEGRQDAALHLALMAERNEVPQVSLGEYLQLLALAETRSVEQARARQSLDRAIGQGYAAEVAQARRQVADRQAAAAREEEQRRQRLEAAYAAAVGRTGGMVGSLTPPPSTLPGVADRAVAAPVVQARITAPENPIPGSTFAVEWNVTANMPPRPPLARERRARTDITAAGQLTQVIDVFDVDRSLRDLGQRWTRGSRREMVVVSLPEETRVSGTGFAVVPPGARMPFDVQYDVDRLRVVFPLYLPESRTSGRVDVRAFAAGPFAARVSLLQAEPDGSSWTARTLSQARTEVIDRNPVVVVQDQVTPEPATREWLSPANHRGERLYTLKVFRQFFEIYEARSGGLIARLSGTIPTFSSSGRYVAFQADENMRIFDVIARETIYEGEWAVLGLLGFSPRSDLIVLPYGSYGIYAAFSPYLDRPGRPTRENGAREAVETRGLNPARGEYLSGHCHACRISPYDVSFNLELFLVSVISENNITGGREAVMYSLMDSGLKFDLGGEYGGYQGAPSQISARNQNYIINLLRPRQEWMHPIWVPELGGREEYGRFNFIREDRNFFARASRATVDMRPRQTQSDPVQVITSSARDGAFRGLSLEVTAPPRPSVSGTLGAFISSLGFPLSAKSEISFTDSAFEDWNSRDIAVRAARRLRSSPPRGLTPALALDVRRIIERMPHSFVTNNEVVRVLSDIDLGIIHSRTYHSNIRESERLPSYRPEQDFDAPNSRDAVIWSWKIGGVEASLLRIRDSDGGNAGPLMTWCLFSSRLIVELGSRAQYCASGPTEARDFYGADRTSRDLYELAVSPDGRLVAVANRTPGQIWIADTQRGLGRAGSFAASEAAGLAALEFSADSRLLLQANRDGRFFVYDVAAGALLLSGVRLDDEFVIYDEQGFYDATPEGAYYVYRFFTGLREHHSFAQFRSHFHRPDIVRALLTGQHVERPRINLVAPPSLEFEGRRDPTNPRRLVLSFDVRGQISLRSLRLFRDGLPLGELVLSGREARLSHTVELPPGRHNLTAVAYDERGFSSNAKTAAVQIGTDPRPDGRLRYVGIAVNAYPRMAANQNLEYAVRDAELLRTTMLGLQPQRRGAIQATVLADAQVTRENIITSLRRAAEETGPDDLLVVSFAGHGARVGERFFFLPYQGSFADAAESGVEWRLIAEALAPAQGRVLVLLDACHSGSASGDAIVPNDAYAEQLMSSGRAGLAVLAAAKGRQFSYEDRNLGGGHGFFSYMIAQALVGDRATADRDRSGTIELDELYAYVKRNVGERTRSFPSGAQTPWLAREEFIGRVSLF